MSAKVAIIGRPNVGKSTLFNRLVGRKLALVDDTPGVTRDRREGEARLGDLEFTIVDTAGLEEGDAATLAGRMRAQTEAALADCDAILFLIDARAGVTPSRPAFRAGRAPRRQADHPARQQGRGRRRRARASTTPISSGLGEPIPFSAEHGEGTGDLYDALRRRAARLGAARSRRGRRAPRRWCSTTRRTAARPIRPSRCASPCSGARTPASRRCSTALLGEERLLTGPEPGLTRDSIGLETRNGATASSKCSTPRACAASRASSRSWKSSRSPTRLRAVRFAEVVVLLLDATIPFEKQDLTLADLAEREGRAVVIGLNKWDLIDDKSLKAQQLRAEADRLLPQLRGVRVIPVSGLTGAHIDKLMEAVIATHEIWNLRISTGRLNRWLAPVIEATPPPAVSGRRVKIRYMTQPKARPPLFRAVRQSRRLDPRELQALPRQRAAGRRSGCIGVPIRLSMRGGGPNPFAPKRRRG